MKRDTRVLIVLVIFSLVLTLATRCLAQECGLRYSISVSKFENKSNWHGQWSLGDAWGAVLTDSLNQTGRFIVLGEKDMRQEAMEEQDFAASGRAAGGGKTVVMGQMTPAQLLVKGAITHFADRTSGGGGGIGFKGFRVGAGGSMSEINVVIYIIDSSTGQLLASKKCYGKVSKKGLTFGVSRGGFSGDIGGFKKTNAGKAMEQAVDEGVTFLISQLENIPWTGKVIIAKGSKIYINRGTREGVTMGQTFDVGKAEVIRDPDTGEILDQSTEKIGTIKVVKLKEKLAICEVVEGGDIKKGMIVVLKE
ncbi:MAG: CsgG/HfaB family protein [Thermodesulfobacteriota bacterium]|nr:CsgG/HfaB family protein [Thermodesulfobacteriota bacterium]